MAAKKKPKQQKLAFAKDAKWLFSAADIPQADNLGRVRSVVAAVDAGVSTPDGFVQATGFSLRHVLYNRRAAILLELIKEASPFVPTKRGKSLLLTPVDSPEERAVLLNAILEAKALQPFKEFFQSTEKMSKEDLGYRIGVMTGLAKETAERRAQGLIAWRRYVRESGESSKAVLSHAEIAKNIHEQIEAQNAKAVEDYLAQLQSMKPAKFEAVVAELIKKMNYDEVKLVGGPGDGGVDVRAVRKDSWGTSHKVAIQAKRYQKKVGRRYVHELMGVMEGEKCQEALLVTTATFAPDAMEAAKAKPSLILVNGRDLVERLIQHGIIMRRDAHGAIVPVAATKAVSKS